MSDPKNYIVGWICAITTEYVAAQAFLDERHDPPEYVSPHDNNEYTLGRVGNHHVVIAVLPDGEYGLSSAASVARDMLHSFPHVRIGLMVGVGGGAPSPAHDIRLGDVVVGVPRGGKGGVWQYDFGKTVQGRSFLSTGFLDQPPTVLRSAVSGVKAQYETQGHQIQEAIEDALERKPRLRRKYRRPSRDTDQLYQSTVAHRNGDSCISDGGEDQSNLVLRAKRTEEDDDPQIHYGSIASANQLMKDALIRDKLAAEHGILCFEMEAAGLMNHFPCLVIRGICDYADTHKSKAWQGYASMTAGAYAKDILMRVQRNRVEAEKKVIDLVSGIQDTVDKLLVAQDHHETDAILDWLTPVEYAPQHNDFVQRRQEGTGKWLLHSREFEDWLREPHQTLFCPGMPGAGKTIITSVVIDHLLNIFRSDQTVGVAYIYCDFKRQQQQTPTELLLNVLKQLARQKASVPEDLRTLYSRHSKYKTRPRFHEVSHILDSVLESYSRTFIVLDALDECQWKIGSLDFLATIFQHQARRTVNIFATSRPTPKIEDIFKGCLSVQVRADDLDVRRYLNGHISQLPQFVSRNPGLWEEVVVAIVAAVDGMFLLARLHLDSLDDKTSPKALRKALADLPKGTSAYTQAYDKIMARIEAQKRGYYDLAKQVLSWIICASERLTTTELQHAIAIELDTPELDESNFRDLDDMVSACAGLVTVDRESDIVRLVHYTTHEYFTRTWRTWFPEAHDLIANSCITCLSYDAFSTGSTGIVQVYKERLRRNPLYLDAALNWGHHAVMASLKEPRMMNFLANSAKVAACYQAIETGVAYGTCPEFLSSEANGLLLAARYRLENAAVTLSTTQSPNARDDRGRTPLTWAAMSGQAPVLSALLSDKSVDPDSRDFTGRTPLSYAAEQGREEAVRLLLARPAVDPNSRDGDGRSPVFHAIKSGHAAVVRRLAAADGVELDLRDNKRESPLGYAVRNGRERLVPVLLAARTVDPNAVDAYTMTPLLQAAKHGRADAARHLLAAEGIDPHSKDVFRRTPLAWAALSGQDAVARILLEHREVDSDFRDYSGETPLSLAAQYGHKTVVQSLLETGRVDPDARDNFGRTPLSLAAKFGHAETVRLLLGTGMVDAMSRDFNGNTPFAQAAKWGRDEVVKTLLALEGLDPESKCNAGNTPLILASWHGHVDVVRRLLKTGRVNSESKNVHGGTAVKYAARWGYAEVVRILLEDVKARAANARVPEG